MRFYIRDRRVRKAARLELIEDCQRIQKGLRPKRVLETDIYLTKRCNLHCSYCYFRDYFCNAKQQSPKDPSLDELKLILDKIDGKTYCLVVLGGEPFGRDDFFEVIKYARTKDIYSIRVSTNGLYLTRKQEVLPLIDRVAVSFDCTRTSEYPDQMKILLSDIVAVRDKMGKDFPRLCLAWTTGLKDDFENDVVPLLEYASKYGFEVKFLPVKDGQKVDWHKHKQIVMKALEYAPSGAVTNDPVHTKKLSPHFVFENCLQGVQSYIDLQGRFLYPCDEFPNQTAGSVYEYTLDDLFEAGLRKYGVYPRVGTVCSHCPSGCHSDNSFILRNPEIQIRDLL